MLKKIVIGLLLFIQIGFFAGCQTPTMSEPRQFGAFSGHGDNARRHSCMALVLTIHRQRGWVLRDVEKGCSCVVAEASSPSGDFVVEYAFTIDDRGIITARVISPEYTSRSGRDTAQRWLRYIENSYSRYRNSTYRGLEKRVGEWCVM